MARQARVRGTAEEEAARNAQQRAIRAQKEAERRRRRGAAQPRAGPVVPVADAIASTGDRVAELSIANTHELGDLPNTDPLPAGSSTPRTSLDRGEEDLYKEHG